MEPTATPSATPTATPPPPAGSLGEAEPYCALVDPAAVEDVLGHAFGDSRTGRSRTGGGECIFATGNIDTDPGENVIVSLDRTSNLARWMPGQGWDAGAEYAARRQALDRRQDIPGLGLAASWDRAHFLEVLLEPDVLVEVLFGRAEALDAATALVRRIEERLSAGVPPETNAPIACRLLGYEDVEAAVKGRDVLHVSESPEFDPATACEFSGPYPGSFFELDLTRIVLFRTEDIRTWLMLDKSSSFVDEAIRAQAATYTAHQWLMDLGLYGHSFLPGELPGPKGTQVDVDGACAAYFDPGDEEQGIEPRFEAAFGEDDYVGLLLGPGDGLDVARQLAAIVLERLTAERGGALSTCP